MKESQVAGGREYMTYQITKLMLLSIYSMSYAVFGAGNMKIDQIWPHGILLLQLLRPRSFEGMKPGYGHHCLISYFEPLFKSKMSKKDKSSLFCLLKPAVELSSDFFPFTVSTPVFLFYTFL